MHESEDGWLARIRLPGGRASSEQLHAVARVAARGNGLVDITRRANLQVRGLERGHGAAVAAVLAGAGLIPSGPHERRRNIVATPFGGRQPRALALTDRVVDELDRGLCGDDRLAALPDRFLFAVDDASGALPDLRADVGLTAEASRGGSEAARFRLTIGGAPTTAVAAGPSAAALALDAALAFLRVRAAGSHRAWHVRELPGGPVSLAAELPGVAILTPFPSTPSPVRPGVSAQRDGLTSVTALAPLGRLDARTITGLAELAAERAPADVRFSADRTVTLVDVPEHEVVSRRRGLAELGLLTSAGSGWEGLSACVGTGACAKALIDVRAAATERARLRGPAAPAEHWSACPRRCGEPRDAPLRVAGGARGVTVRVHASSTEASGVADALALLAREAGDP